MGGILFERNKALALLESSKGLIAGTTIRCLLFKIVGFISLRHLKHVTVSLSPIRFYLELLEHSEVWREVGLVHEHTMSRHATQSPPHTCPYIYVKSHTKPGDSRLSVTMFCTPGHGLICLLQEDPGGPDPGLN